jgi:hypothetical protein
MADLQTSTFSLLSPKDKVRLWGKVDVRGPDECWLWKASTASHGYGQFVVETGKPQRIFLAHRIVYFLAYGIDPGEAYVCHKCDVKRCCNPGHLFLGTAADNAQDAKSKGRLSTGDAHAMRRCPEKVSRGERNGLSKLTEADVIEIRKLYATGLFTNKTLGAKFGVDASNICLIVNRKKWAHVA